MYWKQKITKLGNACTLWSTRVKLLNSRGKGTMGTQSTDRSMLKDICFYVCRILKTAIFKQHLQCHEKSRFYPRVWCLYKLLLIEAWLVYWRLKTTLPPSETKILLRDQQPYRTYIRNSIGQSLSWKASSFLASQDTPFLSWNSKSFTVFRELIIGHCPE
jgi:hypothetical protein